MTNDNIPANRILEQWTCTLYDRHGDILVTQYGDGSMQVAWRANTWNGWSPPVDMRPA